MASTPPHLPIDSLSIDNKDGGADAESCEGQVDSAAHSASSGSASNTPAEIDSQHEHLEDSSSDTGAHQTPRERYDFFKGAVKQLKSDIAKESEDLSHNFGHKVRDILYDLAFHLQACGNKAASDQFASQKAAQDKRERDEDALTKLELGSKEVLIKQPIPFDHYIACANEPLQLRDPKLGPRALLIVLDINGTLLAKNPNNRKTLQLRPNVDRFLTYLFSNHKVAFWSSSTPDTVSIMLNHLLDNRRSPDLPYNPVRADEWREKLVTAWTRKELNLGEFYWQNPQVYKQLWQMWSNAQVQASSAYGERWDQTNTILVDDTVEKASSEPYNLVKVKEMVWGKEDPQGDVLAQAALYISKLTDYTNVSSYMRQYPFVFKPEGGEDLTWEYGIKNLLDFGCLRVD